ncbi:MAG TPA: hypothetical protein HPP77_04795 [Candidatus Hydrogenedentes bacterium]|nr:hypothetical protein [Candidatus Hydrogenedentota bacterium]HIJ74974.1 hypothetical protein [Candidatus Hydrogenedentota bacterium]
MAKFLYIAVALTALSATAADPSVTARVDQTTVSVNTRFVLTVEVEGEQLGEPVIPEVDGLIIDTQASITSEEFSFSSGTRMRRSKVRGYYAAATKTGRIEIPPIGVRVDGEMRYSEPIVLTAVKGAAVPPEQDSGSSRDSRGAPSGRQSSAELTWEDLVFLRSDVNKNEVFQGQPLVLTLSVWQLADTNLRRSHGNDLRGEPAMEGFYQSEVRVNETYEVLNGRPYKVIQYQRTLYPTTTGKLTIGSWQWTGIVQWGISLFNRQRHEFQLATPEHEILVKPLPPPPADFSGAVGRFELAANVSQREAMQGVPMKLVVEIRGEGNPDAIGEPQIDKIENAHTSEPDREAETDGPSAVKRFTYAITPLERGALTIPAVRFCYFDPEKAQYETASEGPFTVPVLAAPEQRTVVFLPESPDGKHATVDVLGPGILPEIAAPGPLRPSRPSPVMAPALLAAPVLGYVGFTLALRRKRRFENDTAFARAYRARATCRKRLRAVAGCEDAPDALYRALVGFLADKLGIEEAGLTSNDAERALTARRANAELANTFLRILRACERARYGGAQLSQDEVHALSHAALTNLDALDGALGKERTT